MTRILVTVNGGGGRAGRWCVPRKEVSFEVTAQRSADAFRVQGSLPVTFADYDIEPPDFGGITVEDKGSIEFLLTFVPA